MPFLHHAKDYSCLFCLRTAAGFVTPEAGRPWPEPLPPYAPVALCRDCLSLPPDRWAEEFVRYVNEEREAHNRRVRADRAAGN